MGVGREEREGHEPNRIHHRRQIRDPRAQLRLHVLLPPHRARFLACAYPNTIINPISKDTKLTQERERGRERESGTDLGY